MYIIYFVFGLVASFLVRLILIIIYNNFFKQGFVGDSSVHFCIVKHLKKNPNSKYISQFLISPEKMSYPLGFHRIASLFSLKILRKYSFLPNFLIFGVFGGLYFAYLFFFFSEIAHTSESNKYIIISCLVFIFTTSNLIASGASVAYLKLSERLLAKMTTSFYFLSVFASIIKPDNYTYLIGIFFGFIAIVSSIFARQAIIFASILISIISFRYEPVILLISSLILSILFSGNHFLRGMKHTILTWKLYRTHTKKSKLVKNNLNRIVDLFFVFSNEVSFRDKVKMALKSEPARSLINYPELILLVLLFILNKDGIDFQYWSLVIAVAILYFLTSTQRFNHLGESYRYIEYVLTFITPILIAINLLTMSSDTMVLLMVLYIGLLLLSLFFHYFFLENIRAFSQEDNLTIFLNKINNVDDAVIFPVSMRLGADICARTDAKSFWWQPGIISTGIYDEYIEEYPFLKKDWNHLFEKHKVTHVVCDKKALQMTDWQYDFSQLQFMVEDENYIAYQVS